MRCQIAAGNPGIPAFVVEVSKDFTTMQVKIAANYLFMEDVVQTTTISSVHGNAEKSVEGQIRSCMMVGYD